MLYMGCLLMVILFESTQVSFPGTQLSCPLRYSACDLALLCKLSVCPLQFVLLASEAILLFSVWSSPAQQSVRSDRVQWHWILQACSLLCVYTGLAVITVNKVQGGKQHYTSWHGLMGISVSGSIAVQAAGGIAVMWPSILPFQLRPVTMKRLHAVFGVANYLGAMLTLLLGLYSTWFVATAANSLVWMTCVFSLVVLVLALPLQVVYNHFVS